MVTNLVEIFSEIAPNFRKNSNRDDLFKYMCKFVVSKSSDKLQLKYPINGRIAIKDIYSSIEDVDHVIGQLLNAELITPAVRSEDLSAITFSLTSLGVMVYDSIKQFKRRNQELKSNSFL